MATRSCEFDHGSQDDMNYSCQRPSQAHGTPGAKRTRTGAHTSALTGVTGKKPSSTRSCGPGRPAVRGATIGTAPALGMALPLCRHLVP
jgi:hypothetical protein